MSQASILQHVIHPKHPSSGTTVRPLPMTPAAGVEDEVMGNDPNDLEAILGVLVENAPVAMAMFDRSMRYLLANRQWVSDFGLQHEMPLVGRSQFEVLPNLHPGWRSVYDRALQGHVVRNEHDVMQDPAGRPVIFRWEVRPWRKGKESAVGGLMVTCEKFSPVVIREEAGAVAEAASAPAPAQPFTAVEPSIISSTGLPTIEVDMDGVVQRANASATRMSLSRGIKQGETTFWELFAGVDDATELKRQTIEAIANAIGSDGSAPVSLVTKHPGDDSTNVIRWAVTNAPDAPEDEPRVLLVGVQYEAPKPVVIPAAPMPAPAPMPASDATWSLEKRKLDEQLAQAMNEVGLLQGVEQAYKRRELRQREVLDTMPCGLIVLDERGRPTFHNAHVRDLFGHELKPGELVEDWLGHACLNETHRDEITRIWRESIWRRQLTKIVSLSTADGLLKDFEFRPCALPSNGVVVTIHDVTESSRLEEMLRSSEAKFRALLHDSPVAVILTDTSGAIFEANAAAERMLQSPRAELRRTTIDEWLLVDGASARREAFARFAAGAQTQATATAELALSPSTTLPVKLRIACIKDAEGRFHAAAHFIESIATSEAAPAAEAASTPVEVPVAEAAEPVALVEQWQPLLRATGQGRIVEWQDEAQTLFKLDRATALQRWLHQLFRPSDATGFLEEWQSRVQSPDESFEWSWFGRDGRDGPRSFRVRRVEGQDQLELLVASQVPASVPSIRPITGSAITMTPDHVAAWPVADLDRERLMLTETHHRIKNHLQIISSLLNLQGNAIEDEVARQALRSSQNRIRAIASLHQHLYQLALDQPVSMQDFAAELVSRLRDCHDVSDQQVSVNLHLQDVRPRDEWVLPVVLILNEAISNCFKHAFPDGRKGTVEVRLEIEGGMAHLTVQDDGIGLPDDFNPSAASGLGLKIAGVFADQMQGKVNLKNIIPNGLFFDLQFPIGCVDN